MKLKIEDVKVGERIRQEMGDLTSLKDSILEVGLLNPIIVNEEYELLSGLRRLEACRELGWTEIEVSVFDTNSDSVKNLDLEYHENLGRIDFQLEEQQNYNARKYDLLHPPEPEKGFLIWLKQIWEKIKAFFRRRKAEQGLED